MNILEAVRHNDVKHLIYASSSSVYGANVKMPFSTSDEVNHPVSLYAATKKSNELMAHTYSHLYNIPTTGLLDHPPKANPDFDREHPTPNSSYAPYKVYNIGNNQPVKLMDFIQTLEKHLGIVAKKEFLPMQPGDVKATYADIDELQKDTGFKPTTTIDEGLKKFVEWYKDYYKTN